MAFSLLQNLQGRRISKSTLGQAAFICFAMCCKNAWTSHDRPIDKLLVIGATLIEALEISSMLPPEAATNMTISMPSWCEGELEVLDNSPNAGEHEYIVQQMLCMRVAVVDAQDVHVFEYAVEESDVDTSVVVKYARAYEFLRGLPTNLRHRGLISYGGT
ncbi:hypothetical protein BDW02DRAFT_411995 [Decorospora gaudefroyi]|uniref:Uncharacterized protein n=1 Tax=Decorospora gaudefroyi TaxID=184978 RepID=A0A6A5KBX9_9PLEO|nr:hypothetical protein BDW02DRAFT_411995 [Decorospora gaudefroyi]